MHETLSRAKEPRLLFCGTRKPRFYVDWARAHDVVRNGAEPLRRSESLTRWKTWSFSTLACHASPLGCSLPTASTGPLKIGLEVVPRNGKKCSDTEFLVPAQNVRTGTDLPQESSNLSGQGSKFAKKVKIYSQIGVEAEKRAKTPICRS